MHRFFVPPEACHGPEIALPEPEARHAAQVLRLRAGERVAILNGAGEEILAEATCVDLSDVRLRIVQRNAVKPPTAQITLIQAVPKAKAMDFIIQKAVELGAARVVPVISERTVAQWDKGTAAHKAARWRAAAIEAAKQSGAAWLTTIENPVSIATLLAQNERFDLPLLASLQPEARYPREYFDAFHEERGVAPKTVSVWVGPEGDFTPAEINLIRNSGALPITLGPLVLRCETAALYCLSVISYEVQGA
jgi:16S rRNA (uracil1498-N3)-methyltransferase